MSVIDGGVVGGETARITKSGRKHGGNCRSGASRRGEVLEKSLKNEEFHGFLVDKIDSED
jgi:hypothetical protein